MRIIIIFLWFICTSSAKAMFRPAMKSVPAFLHVGPNIRNDPSSLCEASISQTDDNTPDYGKTSVNVDQHTLDIRKRWRRPELFGTSLIDQTISEINQSKDNGVTPSTVEMNKEQRLKRRRALDNLGITSFNQFVSQKQESQQTEEGSARKQGLQRKQPKVLQLNIGLYCNQACAHCHVESSPLRKETMSSDVAAQCLVLLKNSPSIQTLDLTGGAPELNQQFRYLVSTARSLRPQDLDIIDRCNLTVLQEPGQEDLIDFFVRYKVHIVASLPCYGEKNVDAQRGAGVFDRSISALIALNDAGYGKPGSGLILDLVYNPLGAFLPPEQKKLEEKYKEVLLHDFGIVFNSLFTITNLPIKRFADFLYERGELEQYMELLVRNFNMHTLDNLMCLDTVSVGYDGCIYDCDFNQQLGLAIGKSVFDQDNLSDLMNHRVITDNHCFGCTAGKGSSCGGEIV